jgi:hypothetical protein
MIHGILTKNFATRHDLQWVCDPAVVGASAKSYDFVIHRTCTETFDPLKSLYLLSFQTLQFSKR